MRRERITPIFVIACVAALAYHLLIVYVITPSFTKAFVAQTEEEARIVALHITSMLMAGRDTLPPAEELGSATKQVASEFRLEKLKIFDRSGTIIYSSVPAEIGSQREKEHFHTLISQGHAQTRVVKKGQKTLEGRAVPFDVVETHVPIRHGDTLLGAIEIYYDISSPLARQNRIRTLATILPLLLMFAFLLSVIAVLFWSDRRQRAMATESGWAHSPYFSLLFTLISIFLVEFLVMLLLQQWQPDSEFTRAMVDALLLAFFLTPLLHLFINRPLIQHLAERRKAEEALRESQERFRDLFENTTDLIQSVGPDGHIMYVNPAWRRTLGYSEEEIREMNIFDILAPEETAHCQAAFGEVMAGRPVDRIETVFIAKDGHRVLVEGNASAKLKDGKPAYTRSIFHDITARKEAEYQMAQLIGELQKSLAEVKTLSGLLPICSWCKKIRDDKGYWNQLESYLSQHSGIDFSHGVCPECLRKHYPELVDEEEKKG
ncbi:MAG: PAS domain-containing protein [Thermodesulfobacteriota bacterium]